MHLLTRWLDLRRLSRPRTPLGLVFPRTRSPRTPDAGAVREIGTTAKTASSRSTDGARPERVLTPERGVPHHGGTSFFPDVEPIRYRGPETDDPLAFPVVRRGTGRGGPQHGRGPAHGGLLLAQLRLAGERRVRRRHVRSSLERPGRRADGRRGGQDDRRVRVLREARRSLLLLPRSRHRARGRLVQGVVPQPRRDGRRAAPGTWNARVCGCSGARRTVLATAATWPGAATNPDPDVFAYAAAQVCHALEATHRLGGENYVLWGGREGYETLLNTDMRRELDQLGRFLTWWSSTSTRSASRARS